MLRNALFLSVHVFRFQSTQISFFVFTQKHYRYAPFASSSLAYLANKKTHTHTHPNSSNLFSLKPVFMIPHRCSIINTNKKAPLTPNTHFPMIFETVYYQKKKNKKQSVQHINPFVLLFTSQFDPVFPPSATLCEREPVHFCLLYLPVSVRLLLLALVQIVLFAVPSLYRFLMYMFRSVCACAFAPNIAFPLSQSAVLLEKPLPPCFLLHPSIFKLLLLVCSFSFIQTATFFASLSMHIILYTSTPLSLSLCSVHLLLYSISLCRSLLLCV